MSAIETITNTISNAPLHSMIEQMGISIAKAQAALDNNSIETLKRIADKGIEINGETTNLLLLGFVPTFYAFTEACFEMKMEFSMAESNAFGIEGSAEADFGMVAASVSASYSRKQHPPPSASSSLAPSMDSSPPPDTLIELLKTINPKKET